MDGEKRTGWKRLMDYLGLGPASAYGQMDRDEAVARFDRLDARLDAIARRLDDLERDR